MKVGSLCSGIGGIDLALESLGMETTWFVEYEKFCQKILRKHWPSTPIYGDLKKLTSSLPVSPANPSVSQASNKESQTQGTSGPRFSEPSLIYDPLTRSLRTCQVSLLTNTLEPYSETYMKQGTMRNGAVFPRKKSAHLTRENVFSSWRGTMDNWPTPTRGHASNANSKRGADTLYGKVETNMDNWPTPATPLSAEERKKFEVWEAEERKKFEMEEEQRKRWIEEKGWEPETVELWQDRMDKLVQDNWPTPDTQNVRDGAKRRKEAYGNHAVSLHHKVDAWPTPTTAEAGKIGNRANKGQKGLSNHPSIVGETFRPAMNKSRAGDGLSTQPLPGPQAPQIQKDGPTSSSNGPVSHQRWRTPSSSETEGGTKDLKKGTFKIKLGDQVGSRKKLNPMFVEWLMGLEPSWTELPD